MSAVLYAGVDMADPELIPVAGGQACVFTERRPGRETANEDAAVVIPGAGGSGVLAVADGRIFTGRQAHRMNLVDELGTYQEAID